MLTVSNISKAYGSRILFEDASFQVNSGDRIGLVGPNGAGKTTLFSLILQHETPDAGTVNFEKNVSVGHLPQESAPAGNETVLELAIGITPEIAELQKTIRSWDSAHPGAEIDHHDNVHARYDELGGYQLEPRAKKILIGLSFREKDFNRPLLEMSGGWIMRAHLARLLTQQPDLLILDEPTNHLDLESLQWFQEYLKNYPGGIILISHDRNFLNQLVGQILEIRQSKLIRYRGNYDEYLVQRAASEQQLLSAYKNQQREIEHMMDFVNRFRAKNTKAAQAQSKLKQIERMEKIEAPVNDEKKIKFRFPQPQRSGLKVITLEDVRHAYGENVIYSGIEFEAEREQRVVLVGPNGAGKSTLLKILAGVLPVQGGSRTLGHNVKTGYYSQHRVEMLKPERTVFEEGLDTPQHITEEFVRTVLGSFLFRGDDIFKKVSVLSGGEKSRLALVKLLLDPPNVLLMDEPTTHLDMASIDALIAALIQFHGTIIFISHDVHFIRAISSHVVRVDAGRLIHFAGGYDYYLQKTSAVSAQAALTAGTTAAPDKVKIASENRPSYKNKEQKRFEAEERQARSRVRKAQHDVVHQLEKQILVMEERQKVTAAEMEKPETYDKPGLAARLNRELGDISTDLADLTAKWEAEAAKLLEMDGKQV